MASILVVEDNSELLELCVDALTEAGHEVRTAGHGLNALKVLAVWRPQLILVDIMMPVMHGFTLCQYLNADPQLQAIPLVMMSGLMTGDINKSLLADCVYQAFLDKPFETEQLVALVQSLVVDPETIRRHHP